MLPLPKPRIIDQPPDVSQVGMMWTVDGHAQSVPVTALLAVTDLQMYDYELATMFPGSAEYYPADSIRTLTHARAAAWVTRLRMLPSSVLHGRQLVDFASVALRAEQDTLARELIERRLHELSSDRAGAAERAFMLASAVVLFVDLAQDSARLSRNSSIAAEYAAQLWMLPSAGYATMSDSTDVLYRQLDAARAMLGSMCRVRGPKEVWLATSKMLAFINRLGVQERGDALYDFPYRMVATALMGSRYRKTAVDSLNAQLLAPLASSKNVTNAADVEQALRSRFAWIAMLGRPAPSVQAHAWINTPDSVYQDTPRTHTFADGVVYLLAFNDNDTGMLPMLERLHRALPPNVHVLLVTHTDGFIGPDIATPAAEVAWLANYYRTKRHFTVPIAVWAGPRISGAYGSSYPMESPINHAYHVQFMRGLCVVVDGKGIVREYVNLRSRDDEKRIIQHVETLEQ